jgi:hypothetical protein
LRSSHSDLRDAAGADQAIYTIKIEVHLIILHALRKHRADESDFLIGHVPVLGHRPPRSGSPIIRDSDLQS